MILFFDFLSKNFTHNLNNITKNEQIVNAIKDDLWNSELKNKEPQKYINVGMKKINNIEEKIILNKLEYKCLLILFCLALIKT